MSFRRISEFGATKRHSALLECGMGLLAVGQLTVEDCPEPDTGDLPQPERWYQEARAADGALPLKQK